MFIVSANCQLVIGQNVLWQTTSRFLVDFLMEAGNHQLWAEGRQRSLHVESLVKGPLSSIKA